MGRIQEIHPRFLAPHQDLLLLLALQLLVVELGGSALVGGKVSGHARMNARPPPPFLSPPTS